MYSKIQLIWLAKGGRGAKLSDILDYQTVPRRTRFLQVIFCYCSYSWALLIITEVFHLYIAICLFRDIWVLYYVFWSLHSWRSWWNIRWGLGTAMMVDVQTLREAAWTYPWDLPDSLVKFFSGKRQNCRLCEYSPEVPNWQDYQTLN
jgi:hypothetical protein